MPDSILPAHLEPRPGLQATKRMIPARDRLRGMDVAVKLAAGFRQVEALEHEWRLLHGLAVTPHFKIPVEFGHTGAGQAFLTTRWVPGHSLMDAGALKSPDDLLDVLLIALDGLDRLHRSGYVHGDVRPQNVLVYAAEGEPRVTWLDLEFARPYQRLEAGFEVVHGWDGGSGQSGGSRTPRTDLQALGETLVSVIDTLPGMDSATGGCLRQFVSQLQDAYRLLEIRDAGEAELRLREIAATHGVTATVRPADPGPGMSIPNRAAWKAWDAIRRRWVADGDRRCLWVYGPRGCGKTTFLRRALARLAPAGHAVLDLSPGEQDRDAERALRDAIDSGLLASFLNASTAPPAMLMDSDSWSRYGADLLPCAPTGTLLVVDASGASVPGSAGDPGPLEQWVFPGFSARELMRWIAASI